MKCVLRGCRISRPLFSRICFGSWFAGSSSPSSCRTADIYSSRSSSSSTNNSSSSSSNSSDDSEGESGERYDIVIAGGGIVGSALACALGQSSKLSGKKILLLEAGKPKIITEVKEEFSNRVSTINPSSVSLFKKLGVWDEIRNLRAHPVKKMHIWESCSDSFITYENEQMREEVAFVIENDVIVSCLLKRINQYPERVRVMNAVRVKSCVLPPSSEDDSPVKIKLEDGTRVQADLLVGADGANSLVRKTMGVNYIHWSYNQEALVATLQLSERADNHVAWQRFLPTGPIALLPLSDAFSSLVWSNTPENVRRLMELSGEEFVDALNSAMWSEEQQIPFVRTVLSSARAFFRAIGPGSIRQLPPSIETVKDGSRAAFPLSLGHAANYVAHRVALIGDAAHRVHPLAGLGVNLGLRDVDVLTRVLEIAAFEGSRLGTTMHLRDYESQSQRHVVPTMMAIEGLHRLYTTSFTPLVLLRSLGLQLTDACEPLKQRIITHASS